MTTEHNVPEFIMPANISQLTDEQVDELLEGIRARRMQKLIVYAETMKKRELAVAAKLEAQFDKKLSQFNKQLVTVDKALEKLDKLTNEIRGLRLQLGLDPM